MNKVAFDRKLSGRTLLLTLMFCWPLLLFGRPAYFADSLAYYHGGRTATAFLVHRAQPAGARHSESVPQDDTPGARAARSIPYSVLAYALGGSDGALVPLAALQAVLTAFTVTVFLCAVPVSNGCYWLTAVFLALATPAAWIANFAMPDIFAGITILVIATLSFRAQQLTTPVAILLSMTGAFAIASHASHIAIAILLVPLGLWWGGQTDRRSRRTASVWLAAPMAIGIIVVTVAGVVGFGELSIAPKRYPLTLARSIGDGPARWYLERHCATEHYAVCEIFGGKIPVTSNDFLWGPNGINNRATQAQMARLRAEEVEILRGTIAEYPLAQSAAALRGVGRQLVNFRIDEANINQRVEHTKDGRLAFADDPKLSTAMLQFVNTIYASMAALALGWLILGLRETPRERRAIILFVLAGMLVNAIVCAVFSGVSDRYQARVIWLLPLAAALVAAPCRKRQPMAP